MRIGKPPENEPLEVPFGDLPVGTLFWFEGELVLKLHEEAKSRAAIMDGRTYGITDEDMVVPCPNAYVVPGRPDPFAGS